MHRQAMTDFKSIHKKYIANTEPKIVEECMRLKARLLANNIPCICGNADLTPENDPRVCNVLRTYVAAPLLKQALMEAKKEYGLLKANRK